MSISAMEGQMVAFDTIKAGDILYDCHRTKMGNTTMSRMGVWEVRILEIDIERYRALCSWNGNAPQWWRQDKLYKLRRNKPKPRVTS